MRDLLWCAVGTWMLISCLAGVLLGMWISNRNAGDR